MFELEINNKVYKFKFGMGFLRDINKKINIGVNGTQDLRKNMGFQYYLSLLLDGEPEALVEILISANNGYSPLITKEVLDNYIDDENTDIDELSNKIVGFLKKANATKKITNMMLEELKKQEAQA